MATRSCYICGTTKLEGENLITCIGVNLCSQISDVCGLRELPAILRDKKARAKAKQCVHATDGARSFHPSCLDRDPAGAHTNACYTKDKRTELYNGVNQSHKLCDECLNGWCAGGGTVNDHARKGTKQTVIPLLIVLVSSDSAWMLS